MFVVPPSGGIVIILGAAGSALKSHDFSYAERSGFYVAEVVRLRTSAVSTRIGKRPCDVSAEGVPWGFAE